MSVICGDVVRADIVDVNNRLLLAAGSVLSSITIRRLVLLHATNRMSDSVNIARAPKDQTVGVDGA